MEKESILEERLSRMSKRLAESKQREKEMIKKIHDLEALLDLKTSEIEVMEEIIREKDESNSGMISQISALQQLKTNESSSETEFFNYGTDMCEAARCVSEKDKINFFYNIKNLTQRNSVVSELDNVPIAAQSPRTSYMETQCIDYANSLNEGDDMIMLLSCKLKLCVLEIRRMDDLLVSKDVKLRQAVLALQEITTKSLRIDERNAELESKLSDAIDRIILQDDRIDEILAQQLSSQCCLDKANTRSVISSNLSVITTLEGEYYQNDDAADSSATVLPDEMSTFSSAYCFCHDEGELCKPRINSDVSIMPINCRTQEESRLLIHTLQEENRNLQSQLQDFWRKSFKNNAQPDEY